MEDVIAGRLIENTQAAASPIRPDLTAHVLLHKVVMAVIDKGHASDLYEFPDVLAYFGAQVPK